jgi:hypothetical protein
MYFAPLGLARTCVCVPRALPWAVLSRPVGDCLKSQLLSEFAPQRSFCRAQTKEHKCSKRIMISNFQRRIS